MYMGTGSVGWTSRGDPTGERERGAALVEFALVAILLVTRIMGVIEFGYVYGQFKVIGHGAHEGARLAAVDDLGLGFNE